MTLGHVISAAISASDRPITILYPLCPAPYFFPARSPHHIQHHGLVGLIEAVVGLDQLLCVWLEAVERALQRRAKLLRSGIPSIPNSLQLLTHGL